MSERIHQEMAYGMQRWEEDNYQPTSMTDAINRMVRYTLEYKE
jgi:hypothetical protein